MLCPRLDVWRLHCFRLRPERGLDGVEGEGPGGVEGEGPRGLGLQWRASASCGPETDTAGDSCLPEGRARRDCAPSALKTRPPLRPTSQTLASAAAAQHPQAPACASLLRGRGRLLYAGKEVPQVRGPLYPLQFSFPTDPCLTVQF